MWNLYENCCWSREILSFRWSFSALGNICQMIGKIGFVSVIINENVSRMLILFCWPAFVFIGLVLDMNTRLPFACEFSVPYLVCVTERSMFFKDLKLESDFFFFPFATIATNGIFFTICVHALSSVSFKQHILQLKMSHGSLIPGNSSHPILALAPSSLV